jgi:hypothetical protein
MGSGRDPRSPSASSWSVSFQLVGLEKQPASQPGFTDLQSGSKASSAPGVGSNDRTIACQRAEIDKWWPILKAATSRPTEGSG